MSNSLQEKYIQLKEGYKVYTNTVGVGEVKLLTIHGGPGLTHECFVNFPENLNPEGIQVIFYDQLGSFHSEQPDDASLWIMERFVDELHQMVEALNLENQFVFANSWGTMLLIDYMLKYKTAFKGIILSGMPASFPKFKQNISQLRGALPADVLSQLNQHEQEGNTTSPEYQQLLFEHWFNRHYCLQKPWPAPLMKMMQHLSPQVLVNILGADVFNFNGPASFWNKSQELQKITVPTLLVAGTEDFLFEEDIKEMKEKIPNSNYAVVPGGHFCWWDDESEFFTALREFIQEHK